MQHHKHSFWFFLGSAALAFAGLILFAPVHPEFVSEAAAEGPSKIGNINVPIAQPTVRVKPRNTDKFLPPIARAAARVVKKPFGLEIHPHTSPIANDRFNGFHVGTDFETTAAEAEQDIEVSAVCSGPLLFKKWANGYGGVAVQHCVYEGEDVSVIYGHLDEATITAEQGDTIEAGDRIGLLGEGGSEQVDGVRKHLHLGIRRGITFTDIRGYALDVDDINLFMDIMTTLQ